MDGKPNRRNKAPFSNSSGVVSITTEMKYPLVSISFLILYAGHEMKPSHSVSKHQSVFIYFSF